MDGKKVENPPEILEIYELCDRFGWLPSQVMNEDNKTIEEIMVVMNAIAEHEKKQERKKKRQDLASRLGGAQRR